jgi:hypothetical protein
MNKTLLFNLPVSVSAAAKGVLLGLTLAASTTVGVYAQPTASGTISGSGSGIYTYSLIFSDAVSASAPVGSVWYAWVPGGFFLPSAPTTVSAPTGWNAYVNGNSVQYVASSSAYNILPGHSMSGFGYQATFSPAQLAAAPNSGVSVAYSGGLFSDGGDTFVVQMVAVPEPSVSILLISGLIGLFLVNRSVRVVPCSIKPARDFSRI